MIISDTIKMLEEAKQQHGDLDVWVDCDYSQRQLQKDDDPLCKCPVFEKATTNMPDRLVI